MAEIFAQPAVVNITVTNHRKFRMTVTPRDIDGALIDLTGMTTANMYCAPSVADKNKINAALGTMAEVVQSTAIISADATGAVIEFSEAQLNTFQLKSFHLNPLAFALQLTDGGSNNIWAAVGTITVNRVSL